MFKPSETAYELFRRRIYNSSRQFQLRSAAANIHNKTDTIDIDDIIDVKAMTPSDVPIAALDIISQFIHSFPGSRAEVIHISMNSSLCLNLNQSRYLECNQDNPLGQAIIDGRVRGLMVHSSIQLLAALSHIQSLVQSINESHPPILLLMEDLTSLLVDDGKEAHNSESMAINVKVIIQAIKECKGLYIFWLGPGILHKHLLIQLCLSFSISI